MASVMKERLTSISSKDSLDTRDANRGFPPTPKVQSFPIVFQVSQFPIQVFSIPIPANHRWINAKSEAGAIGIEIW